MGSTDDLTKLTIPQLKALCKDRKITGFSKLNKLALLQKLGVDSSAMQASSSSTRTTVKQKGRVQGADVASSVASGSTTTRLVDATDDATSTPCTMSEPDEHSILSEANPTVSAPGASTFLERQPGPSSDRQPNETLQTRPEQPGEAAPVTDEPPSPQQTRPSHEASITSQLQNEQTRPPRVGSLVPVTSWTNPNPAPSLARKRDREHDPENKTKRKFPRDLLPVNNLANALLGHIPRHLVSSGQTSPVQTRLDSNAPGRRPNLGSAPLLGDRNGNADRQRSASNSVLKSTRRFAPLIPNGQGPPRVIASRYPPALLSAALRTSAPRWSSEWLLPWAYLEFSAAQYLPDFRPINMPPTIAQRKNVHRLSLVLSFLDDNTVWSLATLSRLYRYSVYSSATHRLARYFSGKRLDKVFSNYSPSLMNYWPYLRQRIAERQRRRELYDRSFLGRFFASSRNIISPGLWASPNHPKQLTIAIRFLMTLLYFHISVHYDPEASFMSQSIVFAEEVVTDEIWMIGVKSFTGTRYFYVLESTCEVVGLVNASKQGKEKEAGNEWDQQFAPRADWSAYIAFRMEAAALTRLRRPNVDPIPSTKRLNDFMRWPNHEEYLRGISKSWLRRIEGEGVLGAYKRDVAERYTMACVVGNSISGRAMTSTEMEHEFKGMPAKTLSEQPNRQHRTTKPTMPHLYLPE
ncbi:hypothetical protein CC2G_012719 [Coprinopsis cinerea AmutBmut pab1-1]|nr:hypothetical protein CC2G_012719 [Coprinopsis cinerea AmutBmut pab1-1]